MLGLITSAATASALFGGSSASSSSASQIYKTPLYVAAGNCELSCALQCKMAGYVLHLPTQDQRRPTMLHFPAVQEPPAVAKASPVRLSTPPNKPQPFYALPASCKHLNNSASAALHSSVPRRHEAQQPCFRRTAQSPAPGERSTKGHSGGQMKAACSSPRS